MCVLTSAIGGSRDKDIHCFKEQQPCYAGLEFLTQQIKLVSKPKENPFVADNNEIADAAPLEMVMNQG